MKMDEDRFDRLSSRQLDCLRLLLTAGSTKGVAEHLKIAPGTVDQHLKAARRLLGVSDSWTAAQILAAHESLAIQKLDTQPPPVADTPDPATSALTTKERESSAEEGATCDEDEGARPLDHIDRSRTLWGLLFPHVGRPPNDLGIQSRLALICLQAAIATGTIAVLFALIFLMNRFLLELARHGG